MVRYLGTIKVDVGCDPVIVVDAHNHRVIQVDCHTFRIAVGRMLYIPNLLPQRRSFPLYRLIAHVRIGDVRSPLFVRLDFEPQKLRISLFQIDDF